MKRSTKFWQIAGVLVAVVSISFNLYQHGENKAKEYTIQSLGREVAEATSRWLGAERRVAEHERRLVDLTAEINTSEARRQKFRDDAERYKEESDKYKAIAEYYEGKYNDFSPILDLTDSEHFEFFLRWSTPGL